MFLLIGSWSLEDLSAKLGAPKDLVHRKLALWQQHGVLREEAGGHYCVVETGSSKEKMDRGMMLIDSDEERDSNTTTQSEQREEKLQVRRRERSGSVHGTRTDLLSASAALLGLHSGHADKPGQHDAGPYPLHAEDVCGHGPCRHGDGRQRAGGLLAAEGQGASADGLCRGLQTPQIQLMEKNQV